MRWIMKVAALVAVLPLVASACSKSSTPANAGGDAGSSAVAISEGEFSLSSTPATDASGPVTFSVTNDGKMEHEFVVLRTDVAPDALPVESGKASEDGHIDELEGIQPGTSQTLTVDLPAGTYVLVCNLVGHYQSGMHAGFTVT